MSVGAGIDWNIVDSSGFKIKYNKPHLSVISDKHEGQWSNEWTYHIPFICIVNVFEQGINASSGY